MEGSPDSMIMRPARPFTIWFRAPNDISTARTNAWSPPTRACDRLRVAVGWPGTAEAFWPTALTDGRNLPPRPFFLPFLLIRVEVYEMRTVVDASRAAPP